MGNVLTDILTALQAVIGNDAADAVAAFLTRYDSGTNNAAVVIDVKHETDGNMADGFGPAITFSIRDSAGVDNEIAKITAERDGADNTGKLRFYLSSAGTPTERLRIQHATATVLTALNVYYGNLSVGASGSQRGVLTAFRGSGGNTPGCLLTYSLNGTPWYWYAEDDGTARIAAALPTTNGDGTIIGLQF